MGRYNHLSGTYEINLLIQKATEQFDIHDENYIDGTSREKPPDFDLHLALYLLEKEHLSPELLKPLKQWAKDNKMVMSQGNEVDSDIEFGGWCGN